MYQCVCVCVDKNQITYNLYIPTQFTKVISFMQSFYERTAIDVISK